jgi:hypothetical protein
MVSGRIVSAHCARWEGDEVVAILDVGEVVKANITARGLSMDKACQIVGERHAGRFADLPPADGGYFELQVLITAIHLDNDIDWPGRRRGVLLPRGWEHSLFFTRRLP